MKTILRIELDGIGIFNNPLVKKKGFKYWNEMFERHMEFPSPYNDGIDLHKEDKEWFCAYKSVEQMQLWLRSEEIKFFIGMGFRFLLLEVEEYQEGEYQIIYTKESIKECKDITAIFN